MAQMLTTMARIFTYNPARKEMKCFFYLPLP